MIILRSKNYSVPNPGDVTDPTTNSSAQPDMEDAMRSQEISARDLQIERMKLQRQQMQINNQRQQLQVKEQISKNRQLTQLQKAEKEKEQSVGKDRIRIRQQENNNQTPNNTGLYKSKAHAVQPTSMPRK